MMWMILEVPTVGNRSTELGVDLTGQPRLHFFKHTAASIARDRDTRVFFD